MVSYENMRWHDLERHTAFIFKTKTKIRCLDGYGFIRPQRNKKERENSKIYIVNSKYIDSYYISKSFKNYICFG